MAASQPKSYKQMSDELGQIIVWFENEEPDLDEAIIKYEQAMRLIANMEKYLKNAENKIRKISAE